MLNKHFRSIIFVIIGILLVGIFGFVTQHANAFSTPNYQNAVLQQSQPSDWRRSNQIFCLLLALQNCQLLPSPAQDPCLHCHVAGENKGLWTPLTRWTLFGSMGLIFVLGVYRSASVWKNKSKWKPFTHRTAEWIDERYEISEPLSKVLNKPVPKYATRWFYCLGGITGFLFLVQGVTGIMLAFYYNPTPEAAYTSILFIEDQVRFGSAIRMIHHWSANMMIVMCIAHMLRVFIMGAFKPHARTQLGQRRFIVSAHARVRLYRLFITLGSESILGYNCRFGNCRQYSGYWKPRSAFSARWMECYRSNPKPVLCHAHHITACNHHLINGCTFLDDTPSGYR